MEALQYLIVEAKHSTCLSISTRPGQGRGKDMCFPQGRIWLYRLHKQSRIASLYGTDVAPVTLFTTLQKYFHLLQNAFYSLQKKQLVIFISPNRGVPFSKLILPNKTPASENNHLEFKWSLDYSNWGNWADCTVISCYRAQAQL